MLLGALTHLPPASTGKEETQRHQQQRQRQRYRTDKTAHEDTPRSGRRGLLHPGPRRREGGAGCFSAHAASPRLGGCWKCEGGWKWGCVIIKHNPANLR